MGSTWSLRSAIFKRKDNPEWKDDVGEKKISFVERREASNEAERMEESNERRDESNIEKDNSGARSF